jgi:hypothetical protein
MKIKGVIDLGKQVKEKPVDQESVKFLQDVLNGLKQLKGSKNKGLELDLEVKTRDEAKKKIKQLNAVRKTLGIAYATIKIKLDIIENPPAGSPDFRVTASRIILKRSKSGKSKEKAEKGKPGAVPTQNIATLPPAEAIKILGQRNKQAVKVLKATVENPNMAAMVDPQLNKMGLTKEQYIALLDEELK